MTDAPVLAFDDLTYTRSQLDALSAGLARILADRGVGRGHRVAVMSSNRPEFVFAIQAIWRLGASAVLISPAWKSAEVSAAVALSGATHAVGDCPVLADLMPMLHLDDPIAPAEPRADRADPDADAVLVFSSGTTGLPKAVRHTHRSFAAGVRHWRDALQLTAADRMQIVTPPSHILGLLNIATVLQAGAWMRLHRRFDIDVMLRHIARDRITIEMAVAPIALAIASHPHLEGHDLSSLRYIMWCATPVTASVAEEVTRRTGVGWISAYGTVRCPSSPAAHWISRGWTPSAVRFPGWKSALSTSRPAGRSPPVCPVRSGALGVCDGRLPARHREPVPRRLVPHRRHRSPRRGRLSADHRPAQGDGQGARLPGGARRDRGGPARPSAVRDCAVFGVPDGINGEAVIAAVATDKPISADELAALLADRLASYKRPRDIVFVPEIPPAVGQGPAASSEGAVWMSV